MHHMIADLNGPYGICIALHATTHGTRPVGVNYPATMHVANGVVT